MERETKLPSRNTSSLSLPPRGPDLLRQAQAAFKRQRPLSGSVLSSVLGGRRLMDAPLEAKEEASEFGREAASLKVDLVVEGSSRTSSTSDSTVMGIQQAGNIGQSPAHGTASFTNISSDSKSKHLDTTELGSVDVQKKVHFSSFDKVGISSSGAHSQISECLLAGKVYPTGISSQDEFRRINPQAESDVSTLLAKKDLFSTGGSSYSATTCVSSTSAPMLNSSAYSRSSVMDAETGEEFNFNFKPRPTSQGNSVVSLGVTSQTKSADLCTQMAESTRNSVSAPEASVITQEANPSNGQGLVMKVNDSSKAVHIDDKSSKEQQILPSGGCNDVKSHGSRSKLLSSNAVVASLEPSIPEKATRKKNSNSDFFFKVNGKRYQKLGKIGSGGSSEVHKVISSDCSIYALKKINLKGRDYSTAYGFCQEIEYLKRLKGKNHIIQLVDYEVTDKTLLEEVISGSMAAKDGKIRADGYIYMVLEYGEIDLAHMLLQKWKDMGISDSKIDENWLRFYWQQILLAVSTIHEERIVHSDLKPANFLLVRGSLKLIDFGIAKAIMSDTTNIQRDAQVGTLNYMSPEAFMWNEQDASGNTIKCGRPSDIWSLGCILYQMVYGRTPFAEYKTFWAKFKVITDPNHQIKYETLSNPWLIDLMKRCLAWDRDARWRIPQLLQHPFLNPPVPPQMDPLRTYHLKLLMEIAEAYRNNPEVSGLCSQLQLIITNLADV